MTTGDPAQVGLGNPGGLIGFVLDEDGEFQSAPPVGGIPGSSTAPADARAHTDCTRLARHW